MNRKAIVFGDAFMALILGTVVIVMIFSGVFISYNKLLCYTGVAWFTAPPTAHMGTAANTKVILYVTNESKTTYSSCITNCDPDKTSTCSTRCAKYTDQSAEYVIFDVNVRNGGTVSTDINVSAFQGESMLWSKIIFLDSGDDTSISTSLMKIKPATFSCLLEFKADTLDNSGAAPASVIVKPKTFKCLDTGSAS